MQKDKKCGLLAQFISIFNYLVLLFSLLSPHTLFATRFSFITHFRRYDNYGDLAIFKKIPISLPPFLPSLCRSTSVFAFVLLFYGMLPLFYFMGVFRNSSKMKEKLKISPFSSFYASIRLLLHDRPIPLLITSVSDGFYFCPFPPPFLYRVLPF